MTWLWICLIVFIVVVLLIDYSACVVGSGADAHIEAIENQISKEDEDS